MRIVVFMFAFSGYSEIHMHSAPYARRAWLRGRSVIYNATFIYLEVNECDCSMRI